MASGNEEFIFNNGLCSRTRELRERMGRHMTMARMAALLGVPAERYRKYETRSPMPAYLMPRFVAITHSDFDYLLLGKSSSTKLPPKPHLAFRRA